MGLSIPPQFQAEGFRFVKLGSSGEGLKKPFEFFWDSLTLEDARRRYAEELAAAGGDRSKSKRLQAGEPSKLTNYGVDDPTLLQHLQRGGNYGIFNGTGPNGAGLATLDADNLPRLAELVDLSLLPPTMEAGRRAWLEGGGLSLAFRLLEIQDEEGVIPDDLQREADLWSRAETEGHGQAAEVVKDLCIQIMMARGVA